MTKQDLIRELSDRMDIPHSQSAQFIESITGILADQFAKGESVILRGFGVFKVVERKPKVARDIHKGTLVTVPAQRALKFIPYNEIKKRIHNEK